MMIYAKKTQGSVDIAISCSLVSYVSADVLFQSTESYQEPSNGLYKSLVIFVPFGKSMAESRNKAKNIRAKYKQCCNESSIIDVDETYPLHKKLKISMSEIVSLDLLAKDYLEKQQYTIIGELEYKNLLEARKNNNLQKSNNKI